MVPSTDGKLLKLVNNGPAVIGTPITFTASYPALYESFIYEFRDKNDESIGGEMSASSSCQFTHTYKKIPEVKELVMTVTLWQQWLGAKLWRIDTTESSFQLSNNLIGNLSVEQEGTPESATSRNVISTGQPVNVSFLHHDPSHFFDSFDKSYSWSVNGKDVVNASTVTVTLTLNPAAEYNVTCFVVMISERLKMDRHVNLTSKIMAKDPITSLTLDGKYFIPRNPGLDLTISCASGSDPFSFCKEVMNASDVPESNCTSYIFTDQKKCSFHVKWYFRTAGTYNLWIRVTNDVSTLYQNVKITVIDFQIQPSLTFVVIPVVSSIMAIFIIVFGIAMHVQQRRRGFTVEVADFDFSARDDSDLLVKTFFERLRDSLVSSVKGVTLFSSLSSSRTRRERGSSSFNESDSDRNSFREDPDDGYASRSIRT